MFPPFSDLYLLTLIVPFLIRYYVIRCFIKVLLILCMCIWSISVMVCLRCLTGSVLDHRSLPPEFESWLGHIWRVFHLWLRFITSGGCLGHHHHHLKFLCIPQFVQSHVCVYALFLSPQLKSHLCIHLGV